MEFCRALAHFVGELSPEFVQGPDCAEFEALHQVSRLTVCDATLGISREAEDQFQKSRLSLSRVSG